jgi:hypothetical protein
MGKWLCGGNFSGFIGIKYQRQRLLTNIIIWQYTVCATLVDNPIMAMNIHGTAAAALANILSDKQLIIFMSK